jgi:phage shock protein A
LHNNVTAIALSSAAPSPTLKVQSFLKREDFVMKTLRRWTSAISSSFEWMVGQIENHEALVSSAIKEVQEAGARAQVQLKRMRNDGQQMRKRLEELRSQSVAWTERAKASATQDEKRALECLRRKKRGDEQLAELETQEREHTKLEKQLSQDLVSIDERLTRLRQQRNTMRTRQSRAEALQALQSDDGQAISEIDDIFDRWETKIAEYEAVGACRLERNDDLETQFTTEEEERELRSTLNALLEAKS